MPSNIVQSFAKQTNKSEKEVEKLWNKAKEIANDNNEKDNYAYIVSILKNMLNIYEVKINFNNYISDIKYYRFNTKYNTIYTQSPCYMYDKKFLNKNNIKYIINLTEQSVQQKIDIEIIHFPIKDFDVPDNMNNFIQFINTLIKLLKKGNIMIHCMGGNGRTGLVLASLLYAINNNDVNNIIYDIRKQNKRFIETRRQENFVKEFSLIYRSH